MLRRFQVTLHGTGLLIPVEGDEPIRGFYAIRRAMARSVAEAEERAIAALEREERYRELIEATEKELGGKTECKVRVESIGYLSWWRWSFTKYSLSFIFYMGREKSKGSGPGQA